MGSEDGSQVRCTVLAPTRLAATFAGVLGGTVSEPVTCTFSRRAVHPVVGPAVALAPVSWLVCSSGVAPVGSVTTQAALVSAWRAVVMSSGVRPWYVAVQAVPSRRRTSRPGR
jgi:hypothetical protein